MKLAARGHFRRHVHRGSLADLFTRLGTTNRILGSGTSHELKVSLAAADVANPFSLRLIRAFGAERAEPIAAVCAFLPAPTASSAIALCRCPGFPPLRLGWAFSLIFQLGQEIAGNKEITLRRSFRLCEPPHARRQLDPAHLQILDRESVHIRYGKV